MQRSRKIETMRKKLINRGRFSNNIVAVHKHIRTAIASRVYTPALSPTLCPCSLPESDLSTLEEHIALQAPNSHHTTDTPGAVVVWVRGLEKSPMMPPG